MGNINCISSKKNKSARSALKRAASNEYVQNEKEASPQTNISGEVSSHDAVVKDGTGFDFDQTIGSPCVGSSLGTTSETSFSKSSPLSCASNHHHEAETISEFNESSCSIAENADLKTPLQHSAQPIRPLDTPLRVFETVTPGRWNSLLDQNFRLKRNNVAVQRYIHLKRTSKD